MTFSRELVGLRFFLQIAKISLILYEFYFEDIAKISQIVGPLGHTISIKKWHTVFFFLSKYLLSASLQSTSKYTNCLTFTHFTIFS